MVLILFLLLLLLLLLSFLLVFSILQGSLKESRCVRVIWFLANIAAMNLCLGNTLRMNLHRTEVTIGKRVIFCL